MCSDIVRSAGDVGAPQRGAAAVGRASGDRALRLDKRTQPDQGRYQIVLRNYGQGMAEIGWSFVCVSPVSKSGRGDSVSRKVNEERAIRRARSSMRKKILAASADHLLTLTYRENLTDYNQACIDLGKFVRLVKRKLPNWVYIAVAEQQKRGAWHWHLAVCGRQDVDTLRACWLRVAGEGNIDVKSPKNTARNKHLALVRYLGKYLAKGFKDGNRKLNARRFRASVGIVVPLESISLPAEFRGRVRAFVEGQLVASAGQVGYVWEAKDKPVGWACSWR